MIHRAIGFPRDAGIPPSPPVSTSLLSRGLFGIRPAQPGFASISIRPAFPGDWRFAHIDTTVNGHRIRYTMTREEGRVVYDFSGTTARIVELCLPLPPDWFGKRASANVEGVLRPCVGRGDHASRGKRCCPLIRHEWSYVSDRLRNMMPLTLDPLIVGIQR